MTTTTLQLTADAALRPRLAQLVADVLRIPVADIHPAVPLSAMGLDSLGAAELTALIEDEISHELPPAMLFEYPTLESLWRFIESRFAGAPIEVSNGDSKETSIAGMLADAILPADIVPDRSQGPPPDDVLLTGSTGFVGAYLLRSLLRDTPAVVYCLVRPNGTEASDRVRQNLAQYGLWEEDFASRIRCVYGDVTQPLLGMASRDFSNTASSIGAIYHAAAAVDWVRPYEDLRDVNVIGTRELLRLACTGPPKSFHFLSSLAVCYSTGATGDALESDDTLTNLRGLHMGYAQSKCVAESLVRQAAERGSRATVARPTLVSGDSTSGISNADDLLSRFLRGCIDMGAAPDLDWAMDCVPVDHVAAAMVQLARNGVPGGVYHLINPRLRYWRECVLWMCLRGHPLELMPYREWTVRLRETTASHPLYPLRAFFLRTVDEEGGLAVPELYEETRRRRTRCDFSRAMLAQAGTSCPPLDAHLLDRYFDSYTERGLISPVTRATNVRRDACLSRPLVTAIERSLQRRNCDPALRITNVELFPMGGDDSIVAELTSWRRGSRPGLRRARLTTESQDGCTSVIDLVLKSKSPDTDAIAVGEQVAQLCGRQLGDAYSEWRDHIGLTGGHLRELAIYGIDDHRLRLHVPEPLAVLRDDDRGEWVVALEYVNDAQVANAWHRVWIPNEIDAALRGLAALHAVWRDRWEALVSQSWLAPRRSSSQMAEMLPLWSALAANACPAFTSWGGPALVKAHESLLCGIDHWWRPLDSNLHTLIHNDFNPRNIMLRGQPGGALRLCAYDWELATIGAPQRDLAEFLCFTLAPETAANDAPTWVQRYLGLLEEQTETAIDPIEWEAGFRAALCDFLIDRLAMYAMIHRFRPQTFLPRVVRTWLALHNRFTWPNSS